MRSRLALLVLTAGCTAQGLPISADAGAPLDGGSHHSSDLALPRDGGPYDFAVGDLASSRDLMPARDLAAPADLSGPVTSAPCLTGGSILYLDGDPNDFIHPGAETVVVNTWSALEIGRASCRERV